MATITASEVNKLRQQTGAGMMDCKNALVEADGDIEKAIDILRKKGQKLALKRADRDANQGIVIAKTSDDRKFAAILMLNCETDFVAKSPEFVAFTKDLAMHIAATNPRYLRREDVPQEVLEQEQIGIGIPVHVVEHM